VESDDDFDALLLAVKRGDEVAVATMFAQYFNRLVAIGRQRLPVRYAKMRDGEDLALSVFKSFVRRAQNGDFPELRGEGQLSALLFTMVQRRILKYIQYETRERRDQDMTVSHSAGAEPGDHVADAQAGDVTHDKRTGNGMRILDIHADLMTEEIDFAMRLLDTDRQRDIARRILDGQPFEAIADSLDIHLSTVYRTYDRILDVWRQRADE
jgi:DNA-directed RNA polymerase specialized sigma24 family protein